MGIKEKSTLPADPDRSSDIHPVAKRVNDSIDSSEATTDRPPGGDEFFKDKAREFVTLNDLEIDPAMKADLDKAKAIIDEIIIAIETGSLDAGRRSIDPSIFLFPVPFINAETKMVNYRVFGLDAANLYADNEDLLWALRALPYFPMQSMAELDADLPAEKMQKILASRANLLKSLAEMMYDLVYNLDRPKLRWQVNYLQTWQNMKTSNFIPVTKEGKPQVLVVQDPGLPRSEGQKIVIDAYRIAPFRESVLTYMAEKHREKGTQDRDSVRRISLVGVPVRSSSSQIGSVRGEARGDLQNLLTEYMQIEGKAK